MRRRAADEWGRGRRGRRDGPRRVRIAVTSQPRTHKPGIRSLASRLISVIEGQAVLLGVVDRAGVGDVVAAVELVLLERVAETASVRDGIFGFIIKDSATIGLVGGRVRGGGEGERDEDAGQDLVKAIHRERRNVVVRKVRVCLCATRGWRASLGLGFR